MKPVGLETSDYETEDMDLISPPEDFFAFQIIRVRIQDPFS
jgi:hypothetical protein